MYIVVSNAYKGPNKLTKNIEKEIPPFFFKNLPTWILILFKKLGKPHKIKPMGFATTSAEPLF
jgi:hypothetical protein